MIPVATLYPFVGCCTKVCRSNPTAVRSSTLPVNSTMMPTCCPPVTLARMEGAIRPFAWPRAARNFDRSPGSSFLFIVTSSGESPFEGAAALGPRGRLKGRVRAGLRQAHPPTPPSKGELHFHLLTWQPVMNGSSLFKLVLVVGVVITIAKNRGR